MEKWVLMSVDISEGSNYKPFCMGVFNSEQQARAAAIFELYSYKDEMKQKHDIDISVFEATLNAYDDFNVYGLLLSYQKIVID